MVFGFFPLLHVEMTGFEPVTSGLQNQRSPTELHPLDADTIPVGVLGFEPRTSALSELRSSQLSYTPAMRSCANKKSQTRQVWPYPPGLWDRASPRVDSPKDSNCHQEHLTHAPWRTKQQREL